jgi:hypothetical protein
MFKKIIPVWIENHTKSTVQNAALPIVSADGIYGYTLIERVNTSVTYFWLTCPSPDNII